jgi:hypothetical protein
MMGKNWIRLAATALLAAAILSLPAPSRGQVAVGVSIHIGPPALPVYPQPVCPEPGYIWTPGYWAYGPDGYFWVPGTWVVAPAVGLLWTPGYWGWVGGGYVWHAGYWGPHVGFYGGINYGYGYTGVGFAGGEWRGGAFAYNREVTNVNVTVIHNTYSKTVINNTTVNNVSFNGGEGGVRARPTAAEEAARREHHVEATKAQSEHELAASTNRAQLASVNHGRPTVAASGRPGEFSGKGAVAASRAGNTDRPHANSSASANRPAANDRPASAKNAERSDRPPSAARVNSAPSAKVTPSDRPNSSKSRDTGSQVDHATTPQPNRPQAGQHSNGGPKSAGHPSTERPGQHSGSHGNAHEGGSRSGEKPGHN